jgi:hypothetical protein
MIEQEWLSSTDPEPMLWFVRDIATEGQLRLFACSCCRRIWHLLIDGRSRRVVEVAERYARGEVGLTKLRRVRWRAEEAQDEAQQAEWVAEADAGFCYTERYCVILARYYATIAATLAASDDLRKSIRRRDLGSHGWVASARVYAVMACAFETLGDRSKALPEFIDGPARAAGDVERWSQAELLREIVPYPSG